MEEPHFFLRFLDLPWQVASRKQYGMAALVFAGSVHLLDAASFTTEHVHGRRVLSLDPDLFRDEPALCKVVAAKKAELDRAAELSELEEGLMRVGTVIDLQHLLDGDGGIRMDRERLAVYQRVFGFRRWPMYGGVGAGL